MQLEVARCTNDSDVALDACIGLTSIAKQLLTYLDSASKVDNWLAGVSGARLSDAAILLANGLVRVTWRRGQEAYPWLAQHLIDGLRTLDSEELYVLLTEQAKSRLGLIRGFQLILTLERCNSQIDRCRLAVWLVLELCRRQDAEGLSLLARRVDTEATVISSDESRFWRMGNRLTGGPFH